VSATNSATRITAKFKLLRAALKKWSKGLSNLSCLIKSCNSTLEILDTLEEQRPLFPQELNFRKILKNHILKLLKHQKEYWKKDISLDGLNLEMKVQNSFMLLQPKDIG